MNMNQNPVKKAATVRATNGLPNLASREPPASMARPHIAEPLKQAADSKDYQSYAAEL